MKDRKLKFDQAVATSTDPVTLGEFLQEDLAALKRPYDIDDPKVDVPRVAQLAGATRDYGLWRRLVSYLTLADGSHRLRQGISGTPKEDLGPHASDQRSSNWVVSKASDTEIPEPARARILDVLREFKKEFDRRAREDTDDDSVEPDSPWWIA